MAPTTSPAEALAAVRAQLAATVARAWQGLAPMVLPPMPGVELRAVRRPGEHAFWQLLTSGLAAKGFELTLRVPATKEELQPPAWAVQLLSTLVARVGQPRGSIAEGQLVSLGTPLEATLGQEMQAVVLGVDPELGVAQTPHARCAVLLAVGITLDEERLVREWSPTGLFEVMGKADPLMLTDLDRSSLLLAPRARALIEQRADREGSSMSSMWARVSKADTSRKGFTWTLSADAVDTLVSLLKGRIGHLRPFAVKSDALTVDVQPGDGPAQLERSTLTLKLSQTVARAMRSTLRAKPGKYSWDLLPGLLVEVVS